ncbi:MAG: adenosylcobinamide-GDP ribazoletransferase [Methylococcales bacterium]|nr:adenosylcobinamide-GDP ribazoletransferase [Methylococcales bacterium]MDP3007637.1 adenosylcobinamide-GDP ribazoletransferase [Methylococcales bacterium]MDP3840062.1 adenosylcobinamide-GDP ribazoletransferase [Methylococcales bacterium]
MLSLKHLQLAISFYTRVPVPKNLDYTQLPQAVVYLPMIGWLVGGCAAAVFYVSVLLWSKLTALILSLIATVLLTGSFHEDGFADVCDSFGGGYGKAQILIIMKDSRVGSYALVGLVLLLALKLSVWMELPTNQLPWLLLAGHSISRFPPLLLMYRYDYARADNSKSKDVLHKPSIPELLIAASFALLPMLLLPALCSLAIVPVFLVNYCLGQYFYRHIGGYTGDCLGASQQIAELIFYLTVSSLWTFI